MNLAAEGVVGQLECALGARLGEGRGELVSVLRLGAGVAVYAEPATKEITRLRRREPLGLRPASLEVRRSASWHVDQRELLRIRELQNVGLLRRLAQMLLAFNILMRHRLFAALKCIILVHI